VVCNPPYIPLDAWESVAPEARDHDPHLALFSGDDGLVAMRVLEERAARLLRPGGVVGAEHADAQGASAPAVFSGTGRWADVRDHRDLAGRDRYLTARLSVRLARRPREDHPNAAHANVRPEPVEGSPPCRGSRMSTRFDTSDETDREGGLAAAALAIRRGDLVVVPTDTVYGVACDAFDADAVTRLLEAKGRGRDMPPPVLVSAVITLDALTTGVPDWTRVLIDVFWPGPLTLVCTHQRSLQWDLGDTRGTVAVRMPLHDITLELIQRTGPLAGNSANTTGMPP